MQQTINVVSLYLESHLLRILQKAVGDLSIPESAVCKILKYIISIFPYKRTKVRQLRYIDKIEKSFYTVIQAKYVHGFVFCISCFGNCEQRKFSYLKDKKPIRRLRSRRE